MLSTFQGIFELVLHMHAPLRKKRVSDEYAPRLNQSIRGLKRKRGISKRAAVKSPEKWSVYKHLKNAVTKKIKFAVHSYYLGLINEHQHNPKKMRQTISKVLDRSSNSQIPRSLTVEGKRLSRETDVLQALSHHFVSVGQNLAGQIQQNSNDDPLKHITQEESSISFTPVDCNYVRKAIQPLKNRKASGTDMVPIMLIKDVTDLISQPLTMIFNSSLRTGVFPGIWKVAKVTLIFKSGSRSNANNYRPILEVSVFPRILERIVHNQIYEHLKATNPLTMSQSAFQKCCSTIKSLIDSTDKWYDNINDKQLNLTTFLDLKRAFDTANHSLLIGKLR